MKLTGENRKTREKSCPSATLSKTNPTWTDPGSNPGIRGERSATNGLSIGTARALCLMKGTIYEAPHCAIFPSLLLFLPFKSKCYQHP